MKNEQIMDFGLCAWEYCAEPSQRKPINTLFRSCAQSLTLCARAFADTVISLSTLVTGKGYAQKRVKPNLHVIENTNKDEITRTLRKMTRSGRKIYANNGTYAFPKDALLPTTLAAFQFLRDRFSTKHNDVFLIAINSDASMKPFYDGKGTPENEREDFKTRAAKIAGALSSQFPDRQIVIIGYDEETPHELYEHLAKARLPLDILYKFGYGTDPKAPPILGGEFYKRVVAMPMPNDEKPFAFDQTKMSDMPFVPECYRLTEEIGEHGAPYLTRDGKILFPVVPELRKYTASFDPRLG